MENGFYVFSLLQENIMVKGVPIKESKLFKDLSDMNVSAQKVEQYSLNFHKKMELMSKEEAERIIITIFRFNPLVAVKMIEGCKLVADIERLAYTIKPLFNVLEDYIVIDSMRGPRHLYDPDSDLGERLFLTNNWVPYVTLLIEAVFQNLIRNGTFWEPDLFLKFAQSQDLKLHRKGIKAKYLNSYNIRHILSHIPDNRQIELINWFWDQHCYAAKKYGKKETYAGRRVAIMMQSLSEGALWRHLENKEGLSDRETVSLNKEKEGIRQFIINLYDEGNHVSYVQNVLGMEDFYGKLRTLMGNDYADSFDERLAIQKKNEENRRLEDEKKRVLERARKEKVQREDSYTKLIDGVRTKYLSVSEDSNLEWHYLNERRNVQLNLWNYWQGMNFDNVKLMVLGFDWGSVHDQNQEMRECKRKIEIMMKNSKEMHVKYYSCKYKKTDSNIEWLFFECFQRDVRKKHYSDLYFSNLCLGYRKNTSSCISDEAVLSDVRDFMPETLRIVNPKVIFCLGEKVYELFLAGMGMEISEDSFDQCILDKDGNPIIVYKMPHCGVSGVKKIPLANQLERWELVKIDMKSKGVIL